MNANKYGGFGPGNGQSNYRPPYEPMSNSNKPRAIDFHRVEGYEYDTLQVKPARRKNDRPVLLAFGKKLADGASIEVLARIYESGRDVQLEIFDKSHASIFADEIKRGAMRPKIDSIWDLDTKISMARFESGRIAWNVNAKTWIVISPTLGVVPIEDNKIQIRRARK